MNEYKYYLYVFILMIIFLGWIHEELSVILLKTTWYSKNQNQFTVFSISNDFTIHFSLENLTPYTFLMWLI